MLLCGTGISFVCYGPGRCALKSKINAIQANKRDLILSIGVVLHIYWDQANKSVMNGNEAMFIDS